MSIRIEEVSYIYELGTAMSVAALDNVTAEIRENEFIGLIGHTGSGKSTLVQLLNGLLKPTSGRILYDGRDIAAPDFDRKKLRASVGLVFQYPEHQLFEADVLTDVMYGPKNLGLSEDEARAAAVEALGQVGMDEHYYGKSPFDLSGGQKRRAAIAGVLAMHPKYLVLDEPTAGLDPMGREEILGLIGRMQRENGITVVLVSHSMEDVARYADRLLVMNQGKLVYDEIPSKVFEKADELEAIGLSAPEITYILKDLKKNGLPVEPGAMTAEQAAESIIKGLHIRV